MRLRAYPGLVTYLRHVNISYLQGKYIIAPVRVFLAGVVLYDRRQTAALSQSASSQSIRETERIPS